MYKQYSHALFGKRLIVVAVLTRAASPQLAISLFCGVSCARVFRLGCYGTHDFVLRLLANTTNGDNKMRKPLGSRDHFLIGKGKKSTFEKKSYFLNFRLLAQNQNRSPVFAIPIQARWLK